MGKTDSFIGILLAILAHKWAEALTVGISFVKNIENIGKTQAIVLITIFSMATPIGNIVGYFLSNSNLLVQGILMGVSAGTFIYIASAEIIVEEFSVTAHKWKKFLAYCLGMALMISIWFVEKALGG